MLDINFIRENQKSVKDGISAKNTNPQLVDDFIAADEKWRVLTAEVEELRAEQKKAGKEKDIEKAKKLKSSLQSKESELRAFETARDDLLRKMPNIPLPEVPLGESEKDNMVLREVGEKPKFTFKPKDYLVIAQELGLVDIERAAKVSGARFGYLEREAALLEFALVRLAFDTLLPEGFVPVVPPVMIKEEMMKGMGYVDSHEDREEAYFFEKDRLYLIGTSEQSIGPMYSGEIFQEETLPKRFIAFSTCFRREAGSYGKDTKGILRVHQFDKVEMFSFVHPNTSKDEHTFLLSMEEKLMQLLKIPYRVLNIASGDLGAPAAAKFDIEAWLPGQNDGEGEYRETQKKVPTGI